MESVIAPALMRLAKHYHCAIIQLYSTYIARQIEAMMMKNSIRALILVVCFLPLAALAKDSPKVEACVKRGIEYYKEIGSYPTLSSAPNKGRKAADVAREKCRRTTSAF